jgi:hypothetical protein
MVVYGTLQFKEQEMATKEDKEVVEEMTSMGQSTSSHTTSNDQRSGKAWGAGCWGDFSSATPTRP